MLAMSRYMDIAIGVIQWPESEEIVIEVRELVEAMPVRIKD